MFPTLDGANDVSRKVIISGAESGKVSNACSGKMSSAMKSGVFSMEGSLKSSSTYKRIQTMS